MRFLLFTLITLTAMPMVAKAEITEAEVQQFNNNYAAAYETCDMEKIKNYVDSKFADDYVATFKNQQGQPQQMQKTQIMAGMQETIDFANKMKLETSDCNTTVQIQNMQVQGDQAAVQIAQAENMVLTAPNGQTVPVSVQTLCNHLMTEGDNGLMIQKSECVTPQPQQ